MVAQWGFGRAPMDPFVRGQGAGKMNRGNGRMVAGRRIRTHPKSTSRFQPALQHPYATFLCSALVKHLHVMQSLVP
eukprot:364779-Chlamydomonas_euryale.AAC.31